MSETLFYIVVIATLLIASLCGELYFNHVEAQDTINQLTNYGRY